METWKDIPIYEGLYQASSLGRIKRLVGVRCKNERILKQKLDGGNRLFVCLSNDNKQHYFRVHQLVLMAFIGPCPEGMEVCHNDGNHLNNCINNLRYDTHTNNELDKIKHGTFLLGEKCSWAKLNNWQVRVIKRLLESKILKQREIAKIFEVHFSTISIINKKGTWLSI
jgi:hypothetical protein